MKKTCVAACLTVMVLCAAPGFAASNQVTPVSETAVGTTEFAKSRQVEALPERYSLIVNGRGIDTKTLPHALYTKHTAIMVPLKETAEALGYTVTWDAQKGCAHVDMSVASMDVYPNQDTYNRVGKLKNINLDMDAHYSIPADVWKGHLYVPAPMFRLFLNDVIMGSDAVQIMPSKAELDSNGHTDEVATEAQKAAVADADKTPVKVVKGQDRTLQAGWVGGPGSINPMCRFDTVDAMQKDLGFTMVVPHGLHQLPVESLYTVSHTIGQINFTNGGMYRMAKGNEDISGDYRIYTDKCQWNVGDVHILVRGDKGLYRSFVWHDKTYTYALLLPSGLTKNDFMSVMNGQKVL